ncbi:MAG: HNH endonuclease [Robiginitomaculum sp.]|nr:HNH endonuclease [Robiginitomaculum sp.]MCF6274894.1 HNH endonuclease [Robiginitomaculum sp.]
MSIVTEMPELIAQPVKDGTYPCLILNADYQPLSYYPLSLWSWQDAVKAVFLDRVSIVDQYSQEVHSANMSMPLPSVVALKDFVSQNRSPAFTRFNLFLRDGFACVYCGSGQELTFDHVHPRRLGGKTSWDNIVAACTKCNLKKGGRTPNEAGMALNRAPTQPSIYELQAQGRRFPPGYLHKSWMDYLYWDLELET